MVQLVYYELRGRSCRELLRRSGSPHKILMFPEESWARSTKSTYWLLAESWWSKVRCNIIEVSGSQRKYARGMIQDHANGCISIRGSFKNGLDPDFQLTLSSNVNTQDFSMGYSLTGILERGFLNKDGLQPSHFVAVRRKDGCTSSKIGRYFHPSNQTCFKNSLRCFPTT